jgi:PAS domain S-box-containing protein
MTTRTEKGSSRSTEVATDLPQWLWELSESLPDLVAVFTGTGTIQYLNPAGQQLLDLGPNDPAPVRMNDLFAKEELENIVGTAVPEAIRNRSWTGRTVLVTPHGAVVPVLLTINAHRDQEKGELSAMSVVARDLRTHDDEIADRRASEGLFRAITEHAPEILALTDQDGQVQFVSPSVEAILGYSPEEIKAMDSWLTMHPDDQPRGRALLKTALSEPDTPHKGRFRIQDKSGEWHHIEMLIVSRAHDPVTNGVLLYCRDITERVDLEDRLRDQMQALEQAQAERALFLDTIAHDMNQPLSPIILQTHILRHLFPDADGKVNKAMQIIEENAQRLERFLRDFRDASHIDHGGFSLEFSTIDLATRVTSVTASLMAEADARGVRLDRVCLGSFPVDADAVRIDQVLFNLIRNALKFTPPDGRITVRVDNAGDAARCTVIDTGRGLAENELEQVFRPFVQVHAASETNEKGTGLGLAISRGIIEKHGGRLWAESGGLGKGARFVFTLPLVDDDE